MTAIAGSFVYTNALPILGDWNPTDMDVRILWVTASTTADTERGAKFVSDITTLSEYDGSGYPSAWASKWEIGTENDTLDDTSGHDWILSTTTGTLNKSTIGATPGSEPEVTGFIIYDHESATDGSDSPLLAYLDLVDANENFEPGGGAVNITFDTEGIIKLVATLTTS